MPQFTKEGVEQNADLLDLIQTKAKEKDATPAQISLAWMLQSGHILYQSPGRESYQDCRKIWARQRLH